MHLMRSIDEEMAVNRSFGRSQNGFVPEAGSGSRTVANTGTHVAILLGLLLYIIDVCRTAKF